ncbi:hypothetical protein [Roseivirga sp. E12]|uniref:hypothetical protein n=1 Tax=Roseivirga sp. E12 TaxID=2819237 RepID=UPI001ABCFE23|nr:hypothetical protein [Roseivirga sp. E12]MBO3699303.1 hypothetical protein [Roseivirga sp. E12]
MTIKKIAISILLFLVFHTCVAYQETPDSTLIKERISILDSLFVTGAEGFNQINRDYSRSIGRSLIDSQTEGLLIYEVSVDENGQVVVKFMTKLSEEIENAVTNIILNSANGWINIGRPYKVYVPISFSLGRYQIKEIMASIDKFPSEFKPPFVKAFGHSVIRGIPQRTKTTIERKPGDARTNEEIAREVGEQMRKEKMLDSRSVPKLDIKEGVTMKAYNKELEKFETFMRKGKSKKAYVSLSKIIRYNPFDKSLIQQRRRLEKELGKDEYRARDILWLQAMDYIASEQNKKP